jgi:protein-S-isoprenylcysteine O-methyltransferase Ste14
MKMDLGTVWRVWFPLVAGAFALGSIFALGPGPHGRARQIGLMVAVIGLAGVIAARYTLGRSFSIDPKATALVTTGIYSRIRNPIYVSGMFFIGGVLIMIKRPEMLAVFVVLIPMQILRARREAAVLEAKFGEAYREYRKQTWF